MRLKKIIYMIVLMLAFLIGVNDVNAKTTEKCYYYSDNKETKAVLEIYSDYALPYIHFGKGYSKATIEKVGDKLENNTEEILNWYKDYYITDGTTLGKMYDGRNAANINPTCPQYLIVMTTNTRYEVYSTNSQTEAKSIVDLFNKINYNTWYLTKTTAQNYYSEYIAEGIIDMDPVTKEPTCTDYETIFGSKNNPESIRYMVNEILSYVRIIVPILIILFGTIDFAKAVIAGKEDNMKKAQNDFIKRLTAGVVVFFVPTLIDIVMGLADIVWAGDYVHCPL